MVKLGFAKSGDFDPNKSSKPQPYSQYTVREMPQPTPPEKDEKKEEKREKVVITDEMREKIAQKKAKEAERLQRMLKSRKIQNRNLLTSNLNDIKCKEKKFMSNYEKKGENESKKTVFKENRKQNFVELEEDDNIDISAYKHLLKNKKSEKKKMKVKEKKMEMEDLSQARRHPLLNKRKKFSDFIRSKISKN